MDAAHSDDFTLPEIAGLDSIAWFGVIRGGGLVLAIGATELARRRLETADGGVLAGALFVADALRIVGTMVFALTTNFALAVSAFWVATVLRRASRPMYIAWLNQHLESGSRATVLSMSGQLDSFGQVLGGPIVGAIATASLRTALVVTGARLAPALMLYVRAAGQMDSRRTST